MLETQGCNTCEDNLHVACSAAAKQDDCALFDKSMTFLTFFVHATSFIFRCGGKSDLTSDDRERSNEEWPPV